jgi:hypothetical protein
MKKLLLLFAIGAVSSTAMAQYAQSIVKTQAVAGERGAATSKAPVLRTPIGANKTTGGPKEGWFDYASIYYQQGVTAGYYWQVYQDSTADYINSTNVRSSIFTYGLGMSFDPTSVQFKDPFYPATPTFELNNTKPYSIDSVSFSVRYMRQSYNNYNDSVFVDLVATGDANHTFRLQYAPDADGYNVNKVDSTMRFADATYDNVNNKMSDSINPANKVVVRYGLQLKDTASNNFLALKLPMPLNVAAGQKVVAFIRYKSGHTYPMGTIIDSVNHVRLFTYEFAGQNTYPVQVGVDYNAFLWANRQAKYGSTTSGFFTYQGHKLLIPALGYADPRGFGMSDIAFYLKCTNCELLDVKNATPNVTDIKAFPNPANDNITVAYTLKNASAATVTITNAVGQVLASEKSNNGKAVFSTANLSNGIYFYTVEANGQKVTNRFVVAH